MIILYILISFATLRFLVVLVNLCTRQWLRSSDVSGNPTVSVLIPARNEEENIGVLLGDLVETDHDLSLPNVNLSPPNVNFSLHIGSPKIKEIIVYDDQSTDDTVRIVEGFEGVVRLISGGELPVGWLGKNYACHKLAAAATGDWLLFLDADVKVSPDLIRDAVGYAQRKNLRLLSLFPEQQMETPGEWLVVPLMNWILVSLLPLILIRTCRWTSFAAANGQFMLFDSIIYKRFQWHEQVKSEPVEDIKISRLLKKRKFRTATLLSTGQIRCRMYSSYGQAINGFSKNIGQFFSNNLPWMLLFLTLTTILPFILALYLILTPHFTLLPSAFCPSFCPLPSAFCPSFCPLPSAFCLYILLISGIRIGSSILSRQNIFKNLLYWLPQQVVLVLLVWKSVRYRLGRKIDWKGRQV
jgi:glycosyltransferase involved in cell wall biosynthesis